MKSRFRTLVVALSFIVLANLVVLGQAGSISGTVVDTNGAVTPSASVEVKGDGGQSYTVIANDSGVYRVSSIAAGTYTVSVTLMGFKKFVVGNVKVDIGTPTTVNVVLSAGDVSEIVQVTSGGEVLQTQTATVGTNISGRQINQTPIASRDALDLILRLPGVASVGAPRQSSVNGLPKGSLQLTLDGVDIQDNVLRSSDGFFTYVRPRVDAIEEVVVSTSSPGAESTGDGAVQVRFQTKRGTNDYKGSFYWQVRNTALNAAYWYNNRDFRTVGINNIDGKALRDVSKLNQPGFAVGGPIPFIQFGEGVPAFHSGKDRSFFFVNYEEFRLPGSQARQRTILLPHVLAGNFRYVDTTGTNREVNLLNIAGGVAGLPTTADPTISGVLAAINAASSQGTLAAITNDLNRQTTTFTNPGQARRTFLALRFDANITKNHSAEFVHHRQDFKPSIDFINNQDAPYPGGNSYGQGGVRKSYTGAVRSTIGRSIVNEARLAISGGRTDFAQGCCADDFVSQGGRQLNIAGSFGMSTNLRSITGTSGRTTPTKDWTDNLTWSKNNHTFTFGGQLKNIRTEIISQTCCATVGFGIDQVRDAAAYNIFNATTMPNSGPGDHAAARAFYAGLVGRITGYAQTAVLTADGTYRPGGELGQFLQEKTAGLYGQDSWKIRQNLTVTFGLRWQPRLGVTAETGNFARLAGGSRMLYGTSGGPEAQFRPGPPATTQLPISVAYAIGDKITPDKWQNWAPSFGFVWSPSTGNDGFARYLLGGAGKSVFRGGWSRSFVREGLNVALQMAANPGGGSLDVGRTFTNLALTAGTNLRDPGNPNLTPNQTQFTPSFPFTHTTSNQSFAVDENLKTGYVDSFSFGYQRELDQNTVVELRYVGNRGKDMERLRNVNDRNVIENGVFSEYRLAQQNLYANIAANRCQTGITTANCQYNFAYFGPGSGTNPLPITLAYFNAITAALNAGALGQNGSVTSAGSLVTTNYASANFRTAAFTSSLSNVAASPLGWAAALEGDVTRRANALAAGLPANFMFVNPTNIGGAFILDNTQNSWYDSGVIEVRRRLSQGLRVQASYVFSKAQSDFFAVSSIVNSSISNRDIGNSLAKTVQAFDITHNFKVDATYDLPFGRGRQFFGNSSGWVDKLLGGFTLLPVISWQSGSPIQLGNAQLVGMTVAEFQKAVKVRKEPNQVFWLPDDIILNSQRAFATSITSPNGYAATFGGVPPTGRYIAPAGFGNCQAAIGGTCGFNNLVIYGPSFFKFDLGANKRINFGERFALELRANALDVLNHPNFKVGGFGANVSNTGCCGATFGQLGSGSAYRDNNTTNDPGGRVIDLQIRFIF